MIDRVQQLQEQYANAVMNAERLRKIAYSDASPNPAVVEAYFEAKRSEASCCIELQDALWESVSLIDEVAA